MKFKATDEQAKALCALAVNASRPVGLGHIHFKPKDYTAADIADEDLKYGLDYFDGRMVKLYLQRSSEGEFVLPDSTPRSDYQSWAGRYPTYEALLAAAGLSAETP